MDREPQLGNFAGLDVENGVDWRLVAGKIEQVGALPGDLFQEKGSSQQTASVAT